MRLWLDDERDPPKGWVHAKTAKDAIHQLENMRKACAGELPNVLYGWRLGSAEERFREFPIYTEEFFTITHMSFDHDLADVHYDYWYIGNHPDGKCLPEEVREEARRRARKEMTGYDVLLWMAEFEVWPTEECMVHSHNPVGADNMLSVINRYGPYEHKVRWTPYVGPNGTWA